jgi:molecular chaperone HtpG
LWEDFLSEARRFDGRKLLSLFGDTDPVRRPPAKVADFTLRDRLLIGEFIRRHHARLAHEIAIHGIPGIGGRAVSLIDRTSETSIWLSDIAGLIARSHGISLRNTLPFLERRYHIRDFNGLHSIFLMVLLRIADYLQIQAKRAPTETLQVRRLVSPISQGEWKVHSSVRNITTAVDDPEAVYIDAAPQDIQSFLRLREWIQGIQAELDLSWAVLGEVYGRYSQERLDNLGLKLRRMRSSIDDTESFSKSVGYVPARITFEAANPDLLKLLVGPLYGDDAAIGLRELIQNAIDAVRELDELLNHRPELKSVERRQQDADVVVTIACDKDYFPTAITIADRGIGMNLDVVENYFLKAGASFRRSDAWRKQFEDEAGRSTVLRSGRFGIGALAAFLLGNTIEVTTRHIESDVDHGLCFSASLDDPAIPLAWVRAPAGTEIRIGLPSTNRF